MANWPPPVSEDLVTRQRRYLDYLENKAGGKVAAAFRKVLTAPAASATPSLSAALSADQRLREGKRKKRRSSR